MFGSVLHLISTINDRTNGGGGGGELHVEGQRCVPVTRQKSSEGEKVTNRGFSPTNEGYIFFVNSYFQKRRATYH